MVLAGAVAALALAPKRRRAYAFGLLALFYALVALGGNTPFYKVLYHTLPGLKRFRAPAMAFGIGVFFLHGLAAVGIRELLAADRRRLKSLQRGMAFAGVPLVLLGLWGLLSPGGLAGALGSFFPPGPKERALLALVSSGWLPLSLVVTGAGLWLVPTLALLRAGGSLRERPLWLLLGGLLVFDLYRVDKPFMVKANPANPKALLAPDRVVRKLQSLGVNGRVLPLFYKSGDDYLMLFGIEQLLGHHPLPPKHYLEFLMDSAYTVLPGPTQLTNLYQNPSMMDALNVEYVIMPELPPLETLSPAQAQSLAPIYSLRDRLVVKAKVGDWEILQNPGALGRAWVVGSVRVAQTEREMLRLTRASDLSRVAVVQEAPKASLSPGEWKVRLLHRDPNRTLMKVKTEGPGLLVMSENWYPYLKARVDGREVPLIRTDHTLRGLYLAGGEHAVEVFYSPVWEKWGAFVSAISLLLTLGLCVGSALTSRRRTNGHN